MEHRKYLNHADILVRRPQQLAQLSHSGQGQHEIQQWPTHSYLSHKCEVKLKVQDGFVLLTARTCGREAGLLQHGRCDVHTWHRESQNTKCQRYNVTHHCDYITWAYSRCETEVTVCVVSRQLCSLGRNPYLAKSHLSMYVWLILVNK